MYLSTLQKHILNLAKKNMIDENLSLNSDAFENSIINYSNLKKANSIIKKMENGSIKYYISLKTKLDKLKVKYPFTQLSNIEPNFEHYTEEQKQYVLGQCQDYLHHFGYLRRDDEEKNDEHTMKVTHGLYPKLVNVTSFTDSMFIYNILYSNYYN